MKRVLDHDVISSFKEYLNHRLLDDLNGFRNETVQLFPFSGARKFKGKDIYSSPYSQWVYDSAISGVQIPSGVGSLNRGTSGLFLDFKNGRVIVDSGTPVSGSLDVSLPDFNIYVTTTPFQKIVLEDKFLYKPYLKPATSVGKSDAIIAPCIVLSLMATTSQPFELGGVDSSSFMIQIGVLADKMYHLMGAQKIIRESARRVFPLCSQTPLNEYNDIKDGYWNYDMVKDFVSASQLLYITRTSFRIVDSDFINENHPNLYLGVGTIAISKFGAVTDYDDFIPYSVGGDYSIYEFDE